jgi:hypothetical protein
MKPIVVFSNFWDANILAKDKYMSFSFLTPENVEKRVLIWLNNFQVYSIALGIPDSVKIPYLKSIFRLNHFCPTYNLLMSYKGNNDWGIYRKEYRQLLKNRKSDIDDWVNGLEQDKVYILCCWEDTSKNCHCHRQILYDAMKETSIWKDKAIWIYRHGNNRYDRLMPSGEMSKLGATDWNSAADIILGKELENPNAYISELNVSVNIMPETGPSEYSSSFTTSATINP